MKKKECSFHSGEDSSSDYFRAEFDDIMKELDSNQAGEGRHKCPYCAYQRGYSDASEEAEKRLAEILTSLAAMKRQICNE